MEKKVLSMITFPSKNECKNLNPVTGQNCVNIKSVKLPLASKNS